MSACIDLSADDAPSVIDLSGSNRRRSRPSPRVAVEPVHVEDGENLTINSPVTKPRSSSKTAPSTHPPQGEIIELDEDDDDSADLRSGPPSGYTLPPSRQSKQNPGLEMATSQFEEGQYMLDDCSCVAMAHHLRQSLRAKLMASERNLASSRSSTRHHSGASLAIGPPGVAEAVMTTSKGRKRQVQGDPVGTSSQSKSGDAKRGRTKGNPEVGASPPSPPAAFLLLLEACVCPSCGKALSHRDVRQLLGGKAMRRVYVDYDRWLGESHAAGSINDDGAPSTSGLGAAPVAGGRGHRCHMRAAMSLWTPVSSLRSHLLGSCAGIPLGRGPTLRGKGRNGKVKATTKSKGGGHHGVGYAGGQVREGYALDFSSISAFILFECLRVHSDMISRFIFPARHF